ncbi:aminotransferase class V [Emticicia oligotrophica DSM 17448]|uniref:Aminotransferase class V n=1 Tax=Emticicia oligotrophica (strain DSM 17448 / CIP 109782 / MTCC 6937 / GPTSA100-15) TaxID=929562 RepID=A0ABM5N2W2_EMTOG|nr:aminotransferase class V-fold PLP-dependent enzyme [Emticicia oligotrophica]AFK03719.1 aminotransferase class V [Emticicia oligotrophica DSM 17448]
MNKRQFLKTLTATSVSYSVLGKNIDRSLNKVSKQSAEELAQNEDFWSEIRKSYRIKPDYINLENGYYSFTPESTLNAFIANVKEINYQASYYMRTRQFDDKAEARRKLAEIAGCSVEELIITRNTTESLDTVIAGIDWKAGDEAVMAEQDYGAMLDMFKLQARRYGIVNKIVSIPNHPKSDEEIVEIYEKAITPKTRLLMVCHMINITGHILPIKKICDMAHAKGVEVMVDGAHAFAQIQYKISDLGCDYYGSSLHKWLSVPLGAGILYVKKDKISKLWQMFGDMGYQDDDIRKLNHTGTHPVHTDLTISNAIDFHQKIGIERKEARLRFLQEYWTKQVRNLPNILLNTPADAQRACGIANVGIKTMKPADLAKTLLTKYNVWTVAIDYANVHGCRITPNVYTSTAELDKFVAALKELAA